LTPRFVGPFEIVEKVGVVAYRIALPPSLSNLHDVFHVSQLRKYVYDESHVIQVDKLEVRDNLTVETWPIKVEDREVKRLRGKEIVLVKVIWVRPIGECAAWESKSRMKVSCNTPNFRLKISLNKSHKSECFSKECHISSFKQLR